MYVILYFFQLKDLIGFFEENDFVNSDMVDVRVNDTVESSNYFGVVVALKKRQRQDRLFGMFRVSETIAVVETDDGIVEISLDDLVVVHR